LKKTSNGEKGADPRETPEAKRSEAGKVHQRVNIRRKKRRLFLASKACGGSRSLFKTETLERRVEREK